MFKTKMRNQQVEEESSVMLSCELSKPGLEVEWRRGQELLKNNFKYQIKSRSGVMELTIKNTQLADSGLYSCSYRDVKTSANLNVTGEDYLSRSCVYGFVALSKKDIAMKKRSCILLVRYSCK